MWAVMPNRKIRYKPFVSQLLQVYKTGLNYQSVLSCLPAEFAQVFQSEVAKATVNRAVKRNRLLLPELGLDPQGTSSAVATSRTWLTGAKSFPADFVHIHGVARTLLPFQSCTPLAAHTYWQQLSFTSHQSVKLHQFTDKLNTTTKFAFIFIPTKILFNCCISAVLYSLPKDRNHWVEV